MRRKAQGTRLKVSSLSLCLASWALSLAAKQSLFRLLQKTSLTLIFALSLELFTLSCVEGSALNFRTAARVICLFFMSKDELLPTDPRSTGFVKAGLFALRNQDQTDHEEQPHVDPVHGPGFEASPCEGVRRFSPAHELIL